MATKQTGRKLDARERARLARTRVDQVRAERDGKMEASLAESTGSDDLDTLVAQLAVVETTIGRRGIQSLFEENAGRVADFLDLDPREVKRLRSGRDDPNRS